MTTAELFATTAARAMTLDPDDIEDVIRDTAGDWPGGGGSEPVSGGGMSNPTETAALRKLDHHDTDGLSDIGKLNTAVAGVIRTVTALVGKCSSASTPDDYEDAVKLAHLMVELDLVATALDVGIPVTRDVFRFNEHVLTIQRIHDGHCAHHPDDTAKLATGDPICLSHARIGDYDRPRYRGHRVCRTCHDLIASIGNPSELDNDPDAWPSPELLREHAHMETSGKRVDYIRERALWIERYGQVERSA